jgi:hypothetical protein
MKYVLKSSRFLFLLTLLALAGCKDSRETGAGDGPGGNKQQQSSTTETGQHIGATKDSTTVDGPKGSLSND